MKFTHSLRWIACATVCGALAFSTLGASAQPMPPADGTMMHHPMDAKWHEKMLAHWEKHHQALKAKLQLTAAQEPAWQVFTAAVKPTAMPKFEPINREELEKLTTPERIQKLTALHNARFQEMQTHMKQHADATLAFYNQLTPEQQKTFDAESLPHARHEHGDKAKAH